MEQFRITFIDPAGRSFGHEVFEAEDDQSAIVVARTVFKCGVGDGYDIWRGSKLIHTEAKDPGLFRL
ncbi:MAG TPA: hypothetical protein VGJ08_01815 [Rhizomicrobium sp.]